jgi:hypothetical protein
MSTTLVKFALLVSLTQVRNYLPVSTTPIIDGLTVLESFTYVNDRNSSPASMTLTKEPDGVEIKLSFTSVNDTDET